MKWERPDANRSVDVEPTGPLLVVRPDEPGATAQVQSVDAAADHLEPGVPRVNVLVAERDIAGFVAADEGEGLLDASFGQDAAIGEADP